jgi:hypothetical protein
VTERVAREVLHGDSSEAEEVAVPRALAARDERDLAD